METKKNGKEKSGNLTGEAFKPKDPEKIGKTYKGSAGSANLAKARANSPVGKEPDLEPGANSKRANFLLEIAKLPPIDRKDIPALYERFEQYLIICAKYDMKIGNLAAYQALGIDQTTVSDWFHGREGTPEQRKFIKFVKGFCSAYRESLMSDSKVHPAVGIFWQKNYDGLTDQQELVVTPNQRLSDMDAATVMKKYEELEGNID